MELYQCVIQGSVMISPLRKLINAHFYECIAGEISAAFCLRPYACA